MKLLQFAKLNGRSLIELRAIKIITRTAKASIFSMLQEQDKLRLMGKIPLISF